MQNELVHLSHMFLNKKDFMEKTTKYMHPGPQISYIVRYNRK